MPSARTTLLGDREGAPSLLVGFVEPPSEQIGLAQGRVEERLLVSEEHRDPSDCPLQERHSLVEPADPGIGGAQSLGDYGEEEREVPCFAEGKSALERRQGALGVTLGEMRGGQAHVRRDEGVRLPDGLRDPDALARRTPHPR